MLAPYITPRAQMDIDLIWAYISQDNPVAATNTVQEFMRIADLLAANPEIGRRREELAKGLRTFPTGNYVIAYRATERSLEIVRVLHGARKLEDLL